MAEKKTTPIMSADAFESELERGIFGAFFFFGEEDRQKYHVLDKVRKSVMTAEDFETFNRFEISFSPASSLSHDELFASLSDALDAVPMMQEQKLIEIGDIIPSKMPSAELDALASACRRAGEDTVMIIFCRDSEFTCEYRFEQSTAFVKIASAATPVRFALLTKARLVGYIKKSLAKKNIAISDAAADTLCDMCACKMTNIDGEMAKIEAYASVFGGEISEDVVKDICSVSAGDEVPFMLSDAMQKWNVGAMINAVSASKDMREEPVALVAKMGRTYLDMLLIKSAMNGGMTTAEISSSLRMNAFRVEKYVGNLIKVPIKVIEGALEELYALDLKLKSSQSDPWMLIDCFVSKVYMPKSMR